MSEKENSIDQDDDQPPVLAWSHELVHLPRKKSDKELSVTRGAEAGELKAVAEALGIVSCSALQTSYSISALGKGRFVMRGTLRAEITQSCIVTLEPVGEQLSEQFEVEFWPADQLKAEPGEEIELGPEDLETRDIEPLSGETVEAGRVIYEVLASGLNLYPRAQGAKFDPNALGVDEQVKRENPFAALAALKGKTG